MNGEDKMKLSKIYSQLKNINSSVYILNNKLSSAVNNVNNNLLVNQRGYNVDNLENIKKSLGSYEQEINYLINAINKRIN